MLRPHVMVVVILESAILLDMISSNQYPKWCRFKIDWLRPVSESLASQSHCNEDWLISISEIELIGLFQ